MDWSDYELYDLGDLGIKYSGYTSLNEEIKENLNSWGLHLYLHKAIDLRRDSNQVLKVEIEYNYLEILLKNGIINHVSSLDIYGHNYTHTHTHI